MRDAAAARVLGRPGAVTHRTWLLLLCLMALYVVQLAVNLEAPVEIQQDGLLSYGIWRVVEGQIPHVDFRAYDPGRYYWGALFVLALGDALWVHRLSAGLFGALGVIIGLLLVRMITRDWRILAFAGFMLIAWSVFLPKAFEPPLMLLGVLAITLLWQSPTPVRYSAAGAAIGLVGLFARNHALYLTLSAGLGGFLLSLRPERPLRAMLVNGAAGMAGVLIGALPLLVAMLVSEPVRAAYLELVRYQLAVTEGAGSGVGWPRLACGGEGLIGLGVCVNSLALLVAFLLPFLFLVAGFHCLRARGARHPRAAALLAASLLVTLGSAIYMATQGGFSYVALGVTPLVTGLAAMTVLGRDRAGRVMAGILVCVLAITALGAVPRHGGLTRLLLPQAYVERETPAGRVHLAAYEGLKAFDRVARFDAVALLFHSGACREGMFLAADLPLLYYLYRCPAPVWDIRPLRPATADREQRLIAELEAAHPLWAVLPSEEAAEREAFVTAYLAAFAWLREHYEPVEVSAPGELVVWRREVGERVSTLGPNRWATRTSTTPAADPARLVAP